MESCKMRQDDGTIVSQNGCKTGVTYFTQRETTFETFAHEVGHSFGASHSFEEGRGRTGGIMDYGHNKLISGELQFNTKYRKREICNHLTRAMQPSCTFWGLHVGGPTATRAPTGAPTR